MTFGSDSQGGANMASFGDPTMTQSMTNFMSRSESSSSDDQSNDEPKLAKHELYKEEFQT